MTRRLLRRDPDASAARTAASGRSRRLVIAAALRRARDDDDAVTEVIGYVLSFALSAVFLLLALNVFWAARANTEHVTTGVELKAVADRVAARIVELGLISQEFPAARMNATLDIPQSFNGRLYTITAIKENVTASTNDGELEANATNFRLDALPGIAVSGAVDSSNGRLVVQYEPVGITPTIRIKGE